MTGYQGPQRLEDAIDWQLVVKRYNRSNHGGDDLNEDEEERNGTIPTNNKNHIDTLNENP